MSVLKANRRTSSIQYTATANFIFDYTMNFMSRLSPRYGRLLTKPVMQAATDMLFGVEKANATYPNSEQAYAKRKSYLDDAVVALEVLDILLSKCYDVMMKNPQGCFVTANKKPIESDRAIRRLDSMAQAVGEAIDVERKLIRGVIRSDKKRMNSGEFSDCINDDVDESAEDVKFDIEAAEKRISETMAE